MRCLLLLHGDEAAEMALPLEERLRIVGEHTAFANALRERGSLIATGPLDASSAGRIVRRGGQVTDGPFAETKEQIGGFYVVECASVDDAVDLAKGIPDSPGLVVEVRAIPTL